MNPRPVLPLLLAAALACAVCFLGYLEAGAGDGPSKDSAGEANANAKADPKADPKAATEPNTEPKAKAGPGNEPQPGDAAEMPLFRFGAVADCQYCDADSKRRRYRLSAGKLRKCVADLNKQNLTHLVHLGDFIDRDWKSFDDVLPIMQESRAPVRFVLGNHDFSVADEFKAKVPGRLGLTSRYYDFAVGKWRFLVLDTNDLSLYAHARGSEDDVKSRAAYEKWGGKLPNYNGGIGEEQMDWLKKKLTESDDRGETVVLHSHHPVYPVSRSHNVWNDKEVVTLLEKHPCVAAYINGHNHDGAYGFKKGIHYLTLKGMVDTEETAYAVIDVFAQRIEIKGRGRQDNYVLEIPGKAKPQTNP